MKADALWGSSSSNNEPAFSQEKFLPYKLVDIQTESDDVRRFRFALGNSSTKLNLSVASCISLRYVGDDGKDVVRPYTPINYVDDQGHFDLIVKRYANSKMGCHLFGLKKGDTIDVKGPWSSFKVAPSQFQRIGMIAGGTGITPMYQILHNILRDKSNTTRVSLLFANHTVQDILLKKELDESARSHKGMLDIHYCTTQPSNQRDYYTGHITKEMIRETMPTPQNKEGICIFVSGPPSFMKTMCGSKDYSSAPPKQGPLQGYLKEMGYDETCVYKF